jgi:cytochrome c biogenesis protein CcmG/thiol:disulfide interchange protein DsbE
MSAEPRTTRARRSRLTAPRAGALVAGALLAAFVGIAATRSSRSGGLSAPLVGRPAPALLGVDLAGAPVSLRSLRGRPTLVVFFASWCAACRAEAPALDAFAASHRGEVAVVGVAMADAPSSARRFLAETGEAWPVLADQSGRIALDWGVAGPPEAFLVAPDGKVAARFAGPVSQAELDRALAALARPAPRRVADGPRAAATGGARRAAMGQAGLGREARATAGARRGGGLA